MLRWRGYPGQITPRLPSFNHARTDERAREVLYIGARVRVRPLRAVDRHRQAGESKEAVGQENAVGRTTEAVEPGRIINAKLQEATVEKRMRRIASRM